MECPAISLHVAGDTVSNKRTTGAYSPSLPDIAIIADLQHAYARSTLQGILEYCRQHRQWARIHCPYTTPWSRPSISESDAVIVINPAELARLPEIPYSLPRACIGSAPLENACHWVSPDNYETGASAANYFARHGWRSVALVNRFPNQFAIKRAEGFQETASQLGIPCNAFDARTTTGPLCSDTLFRDWLLNLRQPTAIFCTNDLLAVEVTSTCLELDLEIPRQIGVLGVDNDPIACALSPVPLSSIDLGAQNLGRRLAELMHRDGIHIPPAQAPVLVSPFDVIERESTDSLCIHDPLLARTLQFIRSQAAKGPTVSDVVEHVAVNRRSLERKFRQTFRRSLGQEIQMARIDCAKKLLIQTNLSMTQVSEMCGFAAPSDFSHLFKRHTGICPSEYRHTWLSSTPALS